MGCLLYLNLKKQISKTDTFFLIAFRKKTEVRFIRTFFVVLFESIKQMDNDMFKVLVLCISDDKI